MNKLTKSLLIALAVFLTGTAITYAQNLSDIRFSNEQVQALIKVFTGDKVSVKAPVLGRIYNPETNASTVTGGVGFGNLLTAWDSAGTGLTGTSSPTVGYITATSTTATSTFNNAILIGTSTPYLSKFAISDKSGSLGDSYGMLNINSTDTSGGNYEIQLVSPNPDIELIESDQTAPAGVYEMALQSNTWQFNLRNGSNTSFTPGMTIFPLTGRSGIKLGINTEFNSPSAVLELVATSTSNAFDITSDANHHLGTPISGDILTIGNLGRTGFGTSTPYKGRLTIENTGNNVILNLSQTNSATTDYINLESDSASAGNNPCIAWNSVPGAVNHARICSTNGSSYTNSNMTFSVADSSKVLQERMRIDVSGNVGIGTSTPLANLQVTSASANATTSLQFGKPSQNKGTCMTYYDTAGTPVYGYIAAGATAFTYSGTKPSGCQN